MDRMCTIPSRYNGPARSANGGYACGALARAAAGVLDDAPAGALPAVTLHRPPRLETGLTVEPAGRRAHVWDGDELVALVAAVRADVPVVPPVPVAVAQRAQAGFRGHDFHPFPGCFVCGPHRTDGDGLGLMPGPVEGAPDVVACTWTPDDSVDSGDGSVRPEVLWAALDCPGGWTSDMSRRARVLGRMTARIDRLPGVGQPLVLVGRADPAQGRTIASHTALYDVHGAPLGTASAVWVEVDAGDVVPRPVGTAT